MARASKNPVAKSSRGKRRGKPDNYVNESFIGQTFVMDDSSLHHTFTVFIANPLDVESDDNDITIFTFGAYGDHHVAVLNKNLEDGLEEAAEWLSQHASHHLISDDRMKELYDEALEELVEAGEDPEDEETMQQAQEQAETDLTYTESGYLTSWEWSMDEHPDPSLADRIVNKSLNMYRKQYGEDPQQRYASQYGRTAERKAELKRKYGDRLAARRGNPDASTRIAALAARLARGE